MLMMGNLNPMKLYAFFAVADRKVLKPKTILNLMKKGEFKYYPESFGQLKVKVLHMDLDFDVYDDHARVKSDLKIKTLEPLKTLELNAKSLELHSLTCKNELMYKYDQENDKITLSFKKTIPKNTTLTIQTNTTCRPTKNILEGMYYDETPKGAPPTIITQCQQWGFQRIVPCIDDMTAKCTYITKITADKRYTNIITNGDLKKSSIKGNRKTVTYHNTITPMSTYLFFLGCGTYATFKKEVKYPDGKTFTLELLVPPKSDKVRAMRALEVLHDSVLFVYLFTGPDKYKNQSVAEKIWELYKNSKPDYKQIKSLAKNQHWGYKYTGTVYREIGMQNSDFGGMENVGNTTITTNRIMPFADMSDGSFEYMIDVKVHEYYHNLNGSEVTGRSPFEIWLNEAVTVHIEREFLHFLAGEDYCRLDEVLTLLAPGSGTLALDEGAASMPIEPDGFNDCNELITSVTYVKAPEFVRMIQTTVGKENFVKGLDLYHKKFTHGNASREDWIEGMEKASGLKLQNMAKGWLKKTKYPKVKVTESYKNNTLTIKLAQTNGEWEFPFRVALFDSDGKVLNEQLLRITKKSHTINFKTRKPAFISLNRGYTFFGKVLHTPSRDQLFMQARKDNDIVNRYMAYYQLWDQEKTKLLKNSKAKISQDLLQLYYEFLSDENLMNTVGPQFLAIFESVEDPKYAHHYDKLHNVKHKIKLALAKKYEKELNQIYTQYSKKKSKGSYLDKQLQDIKYRSVKNLCISLLAVLDTPQIHTLIKKQFTNAKTASERMLALRLYADSSAKDSIKFLTNYGKKAAENLVRWESFLYVVGGNENPHSLKLIKEVEKSPQFRIEQANDQRGLFLSFAHNKKKSLLTKEGRAYLQSKIIQLAKINEYTTGHLLKILGNVNKMEKKYQPIMKKMMKDILGKLNEKKTPSVYNTLSRIIKATK